MHQRFTLQLVASDPAVFASAWAALGADYQLVTDHQSGIATPDLVILDVADSKSCGDSTAAPVLILDLSLFYGARLVNVVERVTGRFDLRRLAQA